MNTGSLYLIPVDLGNKDLSTAIPAFNQRVIHNIKVFVCENIKTGRRFLINSGLPTPIPEDIQFLEYRNEEDDQSIDRIVQALKDGQNAGLISEAGNACIADPGERLVLRAHQNNIRVIPLVGPSSILLALIASGLNSEHFTFTGYLSRDKSQRPKDIKSLVSEARSGTTQVFMETPYRNNQMLDDLIKTCPDDIYLSVACDLTMESESIKTMKIQAWKRMNYDYHKRPVIFVLGY